MIQTFRLFRHEDLAESGLCEVRIRQAATTKNPGDPKAPGFVFRLKEDQL